MPVLEKLLLLEANTTITLSDCYGHPKPLWTDNRLGRFLRRSCGLAVKIPGLTGSYAYIGYSHNLITNAGHAAGAGRLSGQGSYGAFVNLALGTGTTAPAVTDLTLANEITTLGGARGTASASLSTTSVVNDTLQLTKSWTFTGAATVSEEGIFDNPVSGGTLLARQLIGPYTVATGDVLTITHTVQA